MGFHLLTYLFELEGISHATWKRLCCVVYFHSSKPYDEFYISIIVSAVDDDVTEIVDKSFSFAIWNSVKSELNAIFLIISPCMEIDI